MDSRTGLTPWSVLGTGQEPSLLAKIRAGRQSQGAKLEVEVHQHRSRLPEREESGQHDTDSLRAPSYENAPNTHSVCRGEW